MSGAQRTTDYGVELSLRIGQRVRHIHDHRGQRVTGRVIGMTLNSDAGLSVDVALDAPIVIPPISPDDRAISLYRQCVPAHELAAFDERDELVEELLSACIDLMQATDGWQRDGGIFDRARAAIAKATGGSQ